MNNPHFRFRAFSTFELILFSSPFYTPFLSFPPLLPRTIDLPFNYHNNINNNFVASHKESVSLIIFFTAFPTEPAPCCAVLNLHLNRYG